MWLFAYIGKINSEDNCENNFFIYNLATLMTKQAKIFC